MGAPALAPRRAPSRPSSPSRPAQRPARRNSRPARSGAARKPRANGALAGARRPRRTAGPARPAGPRRSPSSGIAQPALAGAALIPHAAVRTAGAVRDLSDSGLIVRLTSGRGWIAVLCVLLFGIVALNVVSLSINSTSGRVSQAIEHYERSNSALRAEIAEQLSASRVEAAAASLGLAVPAPEDVSYLDAREGDLERLAEVWGGDGFLAYDGGYDSTYDSTSTASGYTAPSAGAAPTAATSTPVPSATAPSTSTPTVPAPSGGGAPTGGVGL